LSGRFTFPNATVLHRHLQIYQQVGQNMMSRKGFFQPDFPFKKR
jgi:hypothetical protein